MGPIIYHKTFPSGMSIVLPQNPHEVKTGFWKAIDGRSLTEQTDALSKVTYFVPDIATWLTANKLKLNKDKTKFFECAERSSNNSGYT